MLDQLIQIIKYESESSTVDFKRDQYPVEKHVTKHELLKDISAMANHPSNEDKFIIIGIKDKNFYDVMNPIDDANYQQFLDGAIEPKVNFEYKTFSYQGHNLAYFRIFNNYDRPYLLKKNIRNFSNSDRIEFKKGDGFIRLGSSTEKIAREHLDDIYKKKFSKKDRKPDLEVKAVWTPFVPKSNKVKDSGIIDLNMLNTSNQSIEVEVEIIIVEKKGYEIALFSELELKHQQQQAAHNSPYSFPVVGPVLSGIHINRENGICYISRSLNPCLKLNQQENIPNVFREEIFFKGDLDLLEGHIIIRNDDFTSGPLTIDLPRSGVKS